MPNFYENGKNYIQEQILLLKFKFNNFLEKKENLIKIILTIFVAYLLTQIKLVTLVIFFSLLYFIFLYLKLEAKQVKKKGIISILPKNIHHLLQEGTLFELLCEIWQLNNLEKILKFLAKPFVSQMSSDEAIQSINELPTNAKKILLTKGLVNTFPNAVQNIIIPEKDRNQNQNEKLYLNNKDINESFIFQQTPKQPQYLQQNVKFDNLNSYSQETREDNSSSHFQFSTQKKDPSFSETQNNEIQFPKYNNHIIPSLQESNLQSQKQSEIKKKNQNNSKTSFFMQKLNNFGLNFLYTKNPSKNQKKNNKNNNNYNQDIHSDQSTSATSIQKINLNKKFKDEISHDDEEEEEEEFKQNSINKNLASKFDSLKSPNQNKEINLNQIKPQQQQKLNQEQKNNLSENLDENYYLNQKNNNNSDNCNQHYAYQTSDTDFFNKIQQSQIQTVNQNQFNYGFNQLEVSKIQKNDLNLNNSNYKNEIDHEFNQKFNFPKTNVIRTSKDVQLSKEKEKQNKQMADQLLHDFKSKINHIWSQKFQNNDNSSNFQLDSIKNLYTLFQNFNKYSEQGLDFFNNKQLIKLFILSAGVIYGLTKLSKKGKKSILYALTYFAYFLAILIASGTLGLFITKYYMQYKKNSQKKLKKQDRKSIKN